MASNGIGLARAEAATVAAELALSLGKHTLGTPLSESNREILSSALLHLSGYSSQRNPLWVDELKHALLSTRAVSFADSDEVKLALATVAQAAMEDRSTVAANRNADGTIRFDYVGELKDPNAIWSALRAATRFLLDGRRDSSGEIPRPLAL